MSILVVGYGKMGAEYVRILVKEIGLSPSELIVVDRDGLRVHECLESYPHIEVSEFLQPALKLPVQAAFILTNTPSHAGILSDLINSGVTNIFVEKPLLMIGQNKNLLIPENLRVAVGYLINFSPALQCLFDFMEEKNLIVREGRAFWGKNRIHNSRPTAGDLEDEAMHPICTMLSAVRFNQRVQKMRVNGAYSTVPFVNEDAQQKACRLDESFPAKPISTSHLALTITTSKRDQIFLTVHSSFVAFEQRRLVEFSLGPTETPNLITHSALLGFDSHSDDFFQSHAHDWSRAIVDLRFNARDKLQRQINAFLEWSQHGERDPRLTDLNLGLEMVKISAAAMHSARIGSVDIDL